MDVELDGVGESPPAVTPLAPERRQQVGARLGEGEAADRRARPRLESSDHEPVVPVEPAFGVQRVHPRHRSAGAEARGPRSSVLRITPASHPHDDPLADSWTSRSDVYAEERKLRRGGPGQRRREQGGQDEDSQTAHHSTNTPTLRQRFRWRYVGHGARREKGPEVSRSEDISRSFYAQLGAAGLANRTRPEWDSKIVAALIEILPDHGRVLDVGCGYGRIALPLSRAGYDVHALDLSPSLVRTAREAAHVEGLAVRFAIGSMTNLPYASQLFDAVICLWSTFNELLEEAEQVRTIMEMWRVLGAGGFALIEGRRYEDPTPTSIESGERRGPNHRIEWGVIQGLPNPHYLHDERSFGRICAAAGVQRFEVFERDWGGRQRLFLRLDRPAA
jgi:SAM-dependent methyltransferase